MYIEKKRIGNNSYTYLRGSSRLNGKVKTRTVAYLGKGDISKRQIDKKIKEISESENINKKFLNDEQVARLSKIKEDFNKKIKKLDSKLLSDMFRDFKTYYIYNTNAIEGNTLTLEETNLLLNENKSPEGKDLREVYDHINEKDTFDFLLEKKPMINKDSIIGIHKKLMEKIDKRVGKLRQHKVRVFGASFETTPPEYLDADISILLKWLNNTKLHPLILSALFHEKFERIHPFYDGNGRTGRMLSNLILIRNGFPPIVIKNKDRKQYYSALSLGHKADLDKTGINECKPIVEFFYMQMIFTYEEIFFKWG